MFHMTHTSVILVTQNFKVQSLARFDVAWIRAWCLEDKESMWLMAKLRIDALSTYILYL